ncbi:MAG: NUDIX hydrolase [Geobacteraceae bacterium]|nr:NUDIX hydrolase [Geobacteraceae bacterium]
MSTSLSPQHTVVVGCLVRNEKNELLLIRHHKRGWEIPQGRVEEGENLIDALSREVCEEAGVEIEPGPLAAVWSLIAESPAIIFTFLGRYRCGSLATSGDSEEAGWFSEAKALEKVTGSVMRGRLEALLKFNGSPVYYAYSTRPYQVLVEQNLSSPLPGQIHH